MTEPAALERTDGRVEQGLTTTTEHTAELAPASTSAAAEAEIQAAMVIAQKFPRNEDQAFQSLIRSCKRPTFAEEAEYVFPRGGKSIRGASVNLAREAARVWGNVQYGLSILRDDGISIHIQGWAWDMQTNTKVKADDNFRKLVQRKRGGKTQWVQPDERDLRELVNRRGAICVRNSLLQILPKDLIEDAILETRKTLSGKAKEDPDAARKAVLAAFDDINVPAAELEAFLEHPVAQASPEQLTELRGVYKSIKDGNSTWAEYHQPHADEESQVDPKKSPLKRLADAGKKPPKPLSKAAAKRIATAAKKAGIDDYDAFAEWLRLYTGTDNIEEVPADLEQDLLRRLAKVAE